MKTVYGTEWFDEDGARFVIEVWMLNDIAMITFDTTGPDCINAATASSYTEAPLKETMAAAMVLLSRWRPERPLYDPFCGSGTIPIEAAMIGWNIAPGLRRTFNSEGWPLMPESCGSRPGKKHLIPSKTIFRFKSRAPISIHRARCRYGRC